MKSKHTKGPWIFTQSINNDETRVTCYIGRQVTKGSAMDHCVEPVGLASNSRLSLSREECLANAHLMAAAPEMLAALAEIQTLTKRTVLPGDVKHGWEPIAVDRLEEIAKKARNAIAKAKGGQA